ncbi:MAG: PDZ domain-containing protein [Planctomycetes bacterium]|nr:PDZ domain-containing protein [Planctomycetota bacterium]
MTYRPILTITIFAAMLFSGCEVTQQKSSDSAETAFKDEIKNSLVFLDITRSAYTNLQPWKLAPISQEHGYGCAVGPYQVLTTARNMIDAAYIKARRFGQNEFIPVTVKAIDYEANLCLLALDPNAMNEPLEPLTFVEEFNKDAELIAWWISAGGQLNTSRASLDRAEVNKSTVSYSQALDYVVANSPQTPGRGRLFCYNEKPVGIAYWSDSLNAEAGLAPAHTINLFLQDARDGKYEGFPALGFSVRNLVDPAMRSYLKMPPEITDGIYVSKVYKLGTGADVLKPNDVVLAIDSNPIDSHGRFAHPVFDRIMYHDLITSRKIGETINFDIFRDGEKKQISAVAKNFKVSEMLVPYYEYGKQPEYIVTAGYVIQKLTRPYLANWGDNWQGASPPHLYNYYRNVSFNPSDEREDILVLSYVLPADISLGFHSLGRIVIDRYNGIKVRRIEDIVEAMKLNPLDLFDTITFENDYPTVVIDRSKLYAADQFIQKNYGINKLTNVTP